MGNSLIYPIISCILVPEADERLFREDVAHLDARITDVQMMWNGMYCV